MFNLEVNKVKTECINSQIEFILQDINPPSGVNNLANIPIL